MKDKKGLGKIIFASICAVIVIVCIGIQFVIKQEDAKLKEEGKKYETLNTETKSGIKIETEYTHVDDEKFYIKIPKQFIQLDLETIQKKYHGKIPKIVFSNEETTINVAISMTDDSMKDNEIKKYKDDMETLLKKSSEVIESSVSEIDHHNVGNIKLISKGTDTDIYNNMSFFSYNDKLVIITFNCTDELKEEWIEVGDFIIDSLFFKE